MTPRHKRGEKRTFREYLSWFVREIEQNPGYSMGFYGGAVLFGVGVLLLAIGVL